MEWQRNSHWRDGAGKVRAILLGQMPATIESGNLGGPKPISATSVGGKD
jgi:hypothetical protein